MLAGNEFDISYDQVPVNASFCGSGLRLFASSVWLGRLRRSSNWLEDRGLARHRNNETAPRNTLCVTLLGYSDALEVGFAVTETG